VVPPSNKGFGSQMIEKVLAGELSAEANLHYAEDGLKAEFIVPDRSFAAGQTAVESY